MFAVMPKGIPNIVSFIDFVRRCVCVCGVCVCGVCGVCVVCVCVYNTGVFCSLGVL